VADRTSNLLWSRCVSCALYVRVAINARKHAAVDGVFEGLRVDVEANRPTVLLMSQRGVAVACETLVGCSFLISWSAGRQDRART
jgi:hypothetical protein